MRSICQPPTLLSLVSQVKMLELLPLSSEMILSQKQSARSQGSESQRTNWRRSATWTLLLTMCSRTSKSGQIKISYNTSSKSEEQRYLLAPSTFRAQLNWVMFRPEIRELIRSPKEQGDSEDSRLGRGLCSQHLSASFCLQYLYSFRVGQSTSWPVMSTKIPGRGGNSKFKSFAQNSALVRQTSCMMNHSSASENELPASLCSLESSSREQLRQSWQITIFSWGEQSQLALWWSMRAIQAIDLSLMFFSLCSSSTKSSVSSEVSWVQSSSSRMRQSKGLTLRCSSLTSPKLMSIIYRWKLKFQTGAFSSFELPIKYGFNQKGTILTSTPAVIPWQNRYIPWQKYKKYKGLNSSRRYFRVGSHASSPPTTTAQFCSKELLGLPKNSVSGTMQLRLHQYFKEQTYGSSFWNVEATSLYCWTTANMQRQGQKLMTKLASWGWRKGQGPFTSQVSAKSLKATASSRQQNSASWQQIRVRRPTLIPQMSQQVWQMKGRMLWCASLRPVLTIKSISKSKRGQMQTKTRLLSQGWLMERQVALMASQPTMQTKAQTEVRSRPLPSSRRVLSQSSRRYLDMAAIDSNVVAVQMRVNCHSAQNLLRMKRTRSARNIIPKTVSPISGPINDFLFLTTSVSRQNTQMWASLNHSHCFRMPTPWSSPVNSHCPLTNGEKSTFSGMKDSPM